MSSEPPFGLVIKAIGSFLQANEGIVVHFEGKGYIVAKDESGEVIDIHEDDSFLNYPDLQMAWMHDEPVGNA